MAEGKEIATYKNETFFVGEGSHRTFTTRYKTRQNRFGCLPICACCCLGVTDTTYKSILEVSTHRITLINHRTKWVPGTCFGLCGRENAGTKTHYRTLISGKIVSIAFGDDTARMKLTLTQRCLTGQAVCSCIGQYVCTGEYPAQPGHNLIITSGGSMDAIITTVEDTHFEECRQTILKSVGNAQAPR